MECTCHISPPCEYCIQSKECLHCGDIYGPDIEHECKTRMLSSDAPIHNWFELSYAQYLTIPRTALQSMPIEWQERFVQCLEQLDERIDWRPKDGRYWVKLKDNEGRFVHDPLMDYERGRRLLLLINKKTKA